MKNKSSFINFEYRESRWNDLRLLIYSYLFKRLTTKSQNLFFRAGDIISIHPQINGTHEKELVFLLDTLSKQGFCDYLIDIGANIGLTSCQSGALFSEVHMFEPNPLCCHILKANIGIALQGVNSYIYEYGLGDENKKSVLTIPKRNWGGAFIKDDGNTYDDSTLARKDGYESINSKNYFEVEIELKKSKDELRSLFGNLESKGFNNGIIKIDVEGYEFVVIKSISECLPESMSAYIIFESWDPEINLKKIVDLFGGRGEVAILEKKLPQNKGWLKFIEVLFLLFDSKPSAKLKKLDNDDKKFIGDVIIKVQ